MHCVVAFGLPIRPGGQIETQILGQRDRIAFWALVERKRRGQLKRVRSGLCGSRSVFVQQYQFVIPDTKRCRAGTDAKWNRCSTFNAAAAFDALFPGRHHHRV